MGTRGSYLLGDRPKDFGTSDAEPSESSSLRNSSGNQAKAEKWLFVVIFLAVTFCVVLLIALVRSPGSSSSHGQNGTESSASYITEIDGNEIEICNTKECIIAAAGILESMNKKVDPCEDFYSFCCGNWKKDNPLPDSRLKWSHFNVLQAKVQREISEILKIPKNFSDSLPLKQVKTFYETCTNVTLRETTGLKPLVDFLNQFGGWPAALNESSWKEENFSWTKTVGETRRQLGAGIIFSVVVFADQRSPLNNSIYIDQTTLGLSRSILIDPIKYKQNIDGYKHAIKAKITLIANYLESNASEADMDRDIDDFVNFEIKLANITEPADNRREASRMYNPMSVNELQNLTHSDLVWVDLLNQMFASTNIIITEDTRIIVSELNYISNVINLIGESNKRILSNYILWRHVLMLGSETTQEMRQKLIEFGDINTPRYGESKIDDCAAQATTYMGMAVGVEYIRLNFHNRTKIAVNTMVEDLRSAFKDLLIINEWMDGKTIPLAMEKADYISKYIAYPDWFNSTEKLEEYYSGLFGITNRSHFANTLAFGLYFSSYELSQLNKPTNRTRWQSHPAEVNAFYSPEYNSITFPAGILQPPFYWVHTPHYLNYGAIGQVIGHEITHGFDDQGRQFDKEGHEGPWWTNGTIDAFKKKEQCIIDQYSGYKIPEINTTINGNTTQGENIADNGGLREAYLAYMKYTKREGEESRLPGLEQFTPLQMFFISNANIWCATTSKMAMLSQVLGDPHSYEKFRVNGPMGNMVEFAENFKCPIGSIMNPKDKCVVW